MTAAPALVADAGKYLGGRLAAGLDAALGSRAGDAFGILLYHRVASIPAGGEPPPRNVTPARFRRQLEGLRARGYTFWPLSRALDHAGSGRPLPPRTGVLTFDDGYEGLHRHVLPVLLDLAVPATIFVATAYVGLSQPFAFDAWGVRHASRAAPEAWRPLTWEQCAEMQASGLVEIGTHTHTHRSFRRRPDELHADLLTSLAVIADRLGGGARPFAFPYGRVGADADGERLREAARSAGVTCALTTDITLVSPGTSPFRWGRLEVVQSDTARIVGAKLDGWFDWMAAGRRLYQTVFR